MPITRRALFAQSALVGAMAAQAKPRPNILWISCEDMSPQMGCYGDPLAITPNLDKLATEGVRYTQAHSVIGVCAPSRSSIISGVYPPSLGTQHMRSEAKIPAEIVCFTEYLRKAGYYCTNQSKTDYNFKHPKSAWDESSAKAHWKNRPEGKPFFAVFNLTITHESQIPPRGKKYLASTSRLKPAERRDPAKVPVPRYYPDTAEVRRDLANVYDTITQMDYLASDLLAEIEQAGLREDTIVFFWSDHGVGLPRAKRWLYDSSTHVPLIVRIPAKHRAGGQGQPGSTDSQLVSLIDLGATVMNLAGIPRPAYMQNRAFLGAGLPPARKYIYGARDRMDERYDMVRMVSDGRYRYIRNFDITRPHYQFMNTPEKGPTMLELRRLHDAGKLPPDAERYFKNKPREELYDTANDPQELRNLASQPAQQPRLKAMRQELFAWMRSIRDLGLVPEPEIMRMEARYGNRRAILTHPDNAGLLDKLVDLQEAPVAGLVAAMSDKHASLRARAAQALLAEKGPLNAEVFLRAMKDESAIVRVASAQLCAQRGWQRSQAIDVLAQELASPDEWTRLAAALALDELEEHARPALAGIQKAIDDDNKYVGRVANHTVNLLRGTHNEVP